MKSNNWRVRLEEPVKKHLELQVRETFKHKRSYKSSKNPSNAQIWVGIANLSRQIFELNLRMNVLERSIKDIYEKVDKKTVEKIVKKRTVKKKTTKKKTTKRKR